MSSTDMQTDALLKRIWRQMTAPQAIDQEQRLREHITRIVLTLTLLALVVFNALVILGWANGLFDFYSVALTGGLFLAVSITFWLTTQGYWEKASLLPPLAFYLIGVYGTFTHGLITNIILLYAIAILLSAMIRSGKEPWLMFVLSALTYTVLGWFRDPNPAELILPSALTVGGSLLGITLLQWFFARQLRHALASSNAYAAVLKEYRNQLEELVAQRTSELEQTNQELQIEIQEKEEAERALQSAHDALEGRVDERTAELSIMLEAARAISSTLDLDSILEVIAKQMVIALNASTCLIYRYDGQRSQIVQWAAWSRDTHLKFGLDNESHDLAALPNIRGVITNLEPLTLNANDEPVKAEFALLAGDLPAKGLLALPLVAGRQTIGAVIVVSADERRNYSSADIRLCRALADQAAVTIDNARLHAETQQRSERLTALHNIDLAITSSLDLKFTIDVLLEQLISQMHLDAALLTLNRQQHLHFFAARGFRALEVERTQLQIGQGLAGRAALERRLIHVIDLQDSPIADSRTELFLKEGLVTGFAIPLIARGDLQGVLEIFYRVPFRPDPGWLNFVETIGGQAAIAIHNTERLDRLEGSKSELEVAYNTTLKTWVLTVYDRLSETPAQIDLLVGWTVNLAQTMQVQDREILHLARGALLHDIGMLHTPLDLLQKPGPLTNSERQQIERHPSIAFDLLSSVSYLKPSLDIPYCHHERWDGSGYPLGLKAREIPQAARIFSVVDVWHALGLPRPHRPAWSPGEARAYIVEHRGALFDPEVVDIFDEIVMRQANVSEASAQPGYAPASEGASS